MPDGPLGPSGVVVCRHDAVLRPSDGAGAVLPRSHKKYLFG